MRDNGIAETGPSAGAEIDHALGHAGFFQQFDKFRCDGRRIARRLQDDGVAADDRGNRHSRHNGAGKIPRRNHRAHTKRNIHQRVALAGQLDRSLRLRKTQGFASIKLAEVDGLGNVGVGLAPIFADFEDQPRHEFHLALAQQIADAKDQAGALFDAGAAPGFESRQRRLHGGLNISLPAFWWTPTISDGCDGFSDLILSAVLTCLPPMTRSYSRPELAAHFGDSCAHASRVVFVAEIKKRLGDKWSLMQDRARPDGGF